jgi:hypothetical protein
VSDEHLRETAATYVTESTRVEKAKNEFQPLMDELYREEVLEARNLPMEEKLILGERLFNWACSITLSGIRNQNPEASEDECQRMLRERIELGKEMGTL